MRIIGLAQGQSPLDCVSFTREDGRTLTMSPDDVSRLFNEYVAQLGDPNFLWCQAAASTPPVEPPAPAGHSLFRERIEETLEHLKVFHRLTQLEQKMERIMTLVTVDKDQVDAVQAALTTLTTDVSTALQAQATELSDQSVALQDIAAKLATIVTATVDPATQAELAGILTAVQGVDASVLTVSGNVTTLDANIKAADPGSIVPVVVPPVVVPTPDPTPTPGPATTVVTAGGAEHKVVESTPGGNAVTPKTTA